MRRRPQTIELGPWPYPDHPRVLIEHPDPDRGLELGTALRKSGYTVGVCTGPDATAEEPTRCPLHGLEPCVVVDGADAVVTALDFDRDDAREVLHGLRTRYASRPVVVLATVAQALELADVIAGCRVLPVDADPARVVGAVAELIPAAADR